MKRALLVGLALMLATGTATAVPSTMNFTGRLSTSSGPVDGQVMVTFRILPDATGGTALWTESHTLTADEGLVFVDLGNTNPLDEAGIFDGTVRYMEIQVGGETLSPRMALNAVPYAFRAIESETAARVGALSTSSIVTTVNAGSGVTASIGSNTLNVALTTCPSNQILKSNGSTWGCVVDNDTPPTGTAPIAVNGRVVSLTTCGEGQIYKVVSGQWACANDAGGAEVDGVIGNEVTGPTNATLIRSGSGNNASPYTLGINLANANTWTGTQTFSAAAVGYQIVTSSGAINVENTSCNIWNGASTCYTRSQIQAQCPSDTKVLGGGCTTQSVSVEDALISRSFPTLNAWRCDAVARVNGGTLFAHAICARLE